MGDNEYQEALKLGKKEYKACVSQGRFPYLPVLDDILSRENIQTEQNMGLMQIPLDFVVGTATKGRTYSFAANFMPILDADTEFACKWIALSDAQVNEGIRDPIVAYEYMNRYYVVEGNKRVSVLKYFKADSIVANVTRKIPKYSEDEDVKLYYEYMKFNQISGLNNIEFSKIGMVDKLLALMGSTAIWDADTDAQVNEGIRDPIVAYEYMNRYYVVEGNKRVSVLKYFKADSIVANVTRKIPKYSEDEDVKLYYEYMKFNQISGLNNIEFSKIGMVDKLLALMGSTAIWDADTRMEFNSLVNHFTKAYEFRGGRKLPIRVGDALTAFINVYGYNTVLGMSDDELSLNIVKCWNEFVMLTEKQSVGLVMDPLAAEERKGRNIFSYFMPSSAKKFTVAFLYPKSPDTSDWIYAHDLGRNYLEETFPDQMKTICVNDVTEERTEQVLNDVIRQGADIIFEVAPQMMKDSLKVAVDHPDVKILNCSLNTSHKYIRTYYARMYEAKFLSGMIAGALAENDRIAYIADYPIYGMIANINAFALGASFTNPRARIYLAWSTSENYDRERFLKDNNIQVVSDQDMITPRDPGRQFGLYECSEDGRKLNLVMPLWNWGVFYEKMIQSILAGSYQSEENSEGRALNYWWGMSAGVIDLICSKNVPTGVKRLVDHLKSDIKKGDIVPFYGEIRAQDGTLKNKKDKAMKPEAIMEMDWLTDNVIGEIPTMGELRAEARPVVQIKGVEEKMK